MTTFILQDLSRIFFQLMQLPFISDHWSIYAIYLGAKSFPVVTLCKIIYIFLSHFVFSPIFHFTCYLPFALKINDVYYLIGHVHKTTIVYCRIVGCQAGKKL